ncbi:MAG: hypothetical protein KGP29_06965 [Proteobacteria bacterium]|mgnify:FL=1|jgi:hypothetical protein|nr:hypothetical protein [Pseudomonadota bacterium]NBV06573.1 hypothetical protein [Pseudomonadota bacterium]
MACKFLEDFNGNKSSKRLAGAFCLVIGSLMKFILFLYGLRHVTATPFDRLDGCADSLIYVGAALIGSGLLELLRQSKK